MAFYGYSVFNLLKQMVIIKTDGLDTAPIDFGKKSNVW